MIPYADLDKALGRWKARKAAREEATPPPQLVQPPADGSLGGEKKKMKSSLDWSMDQAMGSSPPAPSVGDTSEIPLDTMSEESADGSAAPTAETSGDSTGEIDVNDIVDDEEPQP